jgi:hypothetical protein
MKYKKIENFQQFLEYINQVGIIPIDRKYAGWIPYWQSQACNLINEVEKLYNVTYPLKNYPDYDILFRVHFIRPCESDYHGYLHVKIDNNEDSIITV